MLLRLPLSFGRLNKCRGLFNVSINKFPKNFINLHTQTRYSKLDLNIKLTYKTSQRTVFTFMKIFRKPTPEEMQESDKIPSSYKLIYSNKMTNYLRAGMISVYICSISACLLLIMSHDNSIFTYDGPQVMSKQTFIFTTVFIFFTVAVQALVLKMPLRVYNNPRNNRYAFIYYGLTPSKRTLYCTLEDVQKQEETGLLPWKENIFRIKDSVDAILIENYFRTPSDYNILAGYQSPPNNEENDGPV